MARVDEGAALEKRYLTQVGSQVRILLPPPDKVVELFIEIRVMGKEGRSC